MTPMRQALLDYLAIRRALGVALYRTGKALENFVTFAEREHATRITTDLALRWARQPTNVHPATWAERLACVRRFARHCAVTEPRTEIPPDDLLPHRRARRRPGLWSDAQILGLLAAAHGLRSPRGLRARTYETLFGLLSATGLRIGEALGLDAVDLDATAGVLTIRDTKFGKTRYVPVHRSTRTALRRYTRARDRLLPAPSTGAFFVTEAGTRLSESAVRWIYRRVRPRTPAGGPADPAPLRIHDLRHTFAVRTLRRWYRAGRDVDAWLPRLATYLGHAHVNDTYWYLTADPALLRCAVDRVERGERSPSS